MRLRHKPGGPCPPIVALLVTLIAPWALVSAEEPVQGTVPAEHRSVGLALSGGGARGAAHIGVLKVLDELRVPVDYVAGTSMGSIVGGLLASGYSPEELEEVFLTVDWDATFKDAPERKRISFRRKQDDRQALFPLELGVGLRGLSFRSGLITGQQIDFLLRSLSLYAADVEDFDALRIPFRAVATDLDTGDMVVLASGDLARAMRASMSVPGVFAPMEIDGRQLVDGGLSRNLPVDVVRELGAERVIAVDAGTPTKDAAAEPSMIAVASQSITVLTNRNVLGQVKLLGAGDLLIKPDLAEVKSTSFGALQQAIDAGERAARAMESELRRFSVSAAEYAAWRAGRRHGGELIRPIRVDEIEVRGAERLDPRVVYNRIHTRAGEPLNVRTLAADLDRLRQMGEWQLVEYSFEVQDGINRLVIDVEDKTWGPGYLRFGIGAETNFDGDSEFRAIVNYRRPQINKLGAEWRVIGTVGDPARIFTEFFQPFSRSGLWFVSPKLDWVHDREELFLPGDTLEIVESNRGSAGFDLGVQFHNWGEVRVGPVGGRYDGEVKTGVDAGTLVEFDIGGWELSGTLDQLDNAFFPRHGNLTQLGVFLSRESLGADLDYDKLLVETTQAWSRGRNTVTLGARFGSGLGSDIPFFDQFRLGGFLNLSGYARGELQGDLAALATVTDYWQVGRLGSLGSLYVGGALQAGNAWTNDEQPELRDLIYSATLFFGVDTGFSPVYVGWGKAEGGTSEFYLFVGQLQR